MRKINLTEPHECKYLKEQTSTNYQVSEIMGNWYFITDDKKAYGIRNCPYCGMLLKPESEVINEA